MATRDGSPAHGRHSYFRLEQATVTDVNWDTCVVTVQTQHSNKDPEGIQVAAGYITAEGDFAGVLPEVGAIAHIAYPSDNTPPFIIGFIGSPAVVAGGDDGSPARMSASTPEGSPTDISYRNNRPRLNPGDQCYRTRDGNHLILRRGGIVEIGATAISKRIYIPINNFIKDFFENYAMHGLGGDLEWLVDRVENDPSGNAPAHWTLRLNEFAQDEKASVQIRHLSPASPGGTKFAWEVVVAPQGITRADGSVSGAKYEMTVALNGDQVEVMGGAREITIDGNDSLTVGGNRTVRVTGNHDLRTEGSIKAVAVGTHDIGGSSIRIGGEDATDPAVLGLALVQFLGSATYDVAGAVAAMSPASVLQLQGILSRKVRIK